MNPAKSKGVKLRFETNAKNNNAGKYHYGLQMIELGVLKKKNMVF